MKLLAVASLALLVCLATPASAARRPRHSVRAANVLPPADVTNIGPSTSTEPYMVPLADGVSIWSILTANDTVANSSDPSSTVRMAGTPDGMGVYILDGTSDVEYTPSCEAKLAGAFSPAAADTFTLISAHEFGKTRGAVRRHGAKGAFLSKWNINRKSLKVESGEDLVKQVLLWNPLAGQYYPPQAYAFDRFCSGDLPAVSAYYDAASGLGTKDRIFMNGEESGSEGKAFAHAATGPEAGTSYELPHLGKASWEQQAAYPFGGETTVVIGTEDATYGQVYVYIGKKKATGSVVEKAGLTKGRLYGIRVNDARFTNQSPPCIYGPNCEPQPTTGTLGPGNGPFPFSLIDMGDDVAAVNGSVLEKRSDEKGVTNWARPEDGSWYPVDSLTPTFYFTTTAGFDLSTRVWKLEFVDKTDFTKGGVVRAVIEGTPGTDVSGPKMLDNLVATCDGSVYAQEDPGGNPILSRIWRYTPSSLTPITQHNPKFFAPDSPTRRTIDEESSGIISLDGFVLSKPGHCFMFGTQAHYSISDPVDLVEGGQIQLMCVKGKGK